MARRERAHPDGRLRRAPRPGGEQAELIGFFKDITEERRAQLEIARLEDIRDTAEEVAGMASWEYDTATRTTTWTRGTERLFDIADGEHAGDLLALLEARVHPYGAFATLAAFGAALGRGDALCVEYRVVHRDGSEHVLTSLARSRRDDAGRLLVVTGYHRDVTQERRASAEMQTLRTMRDEAERVAGMVSWSIDLGTGAVTRSPGMHQVYDVDDLADAATVETGVRLQRHRRPPAPRGPRRREGAHRRGPETGEYPPGEFRVVHRDGSVHVVRSEARVERDALGAPVRLVGYQQDVTGQRSAEAEVQRLTQQLAQRPHPGTGREPA